MDSRREPRWLEAKPQQSSKNACSLSARPRVSAPVAFERSSIASSNVTGAAKAALPTRTPRVGPSRMRSIAKRRTSASAVTSCNASAEAADVATLGAASLHEG